MQHAIQPRVHTAPLAFGLLVEESYTFGGAAIADLPRPARLGRSKVRATLAAVDEPINIREVNQVDRTESRLVGYESYECGDFTEFVCSPRHDVVLDARSHPDCEFAPKVLS